MVRRSFAGMVEVSADFATEASLASLASHLTRCVCKDENFGNVKCPYQIATHMQTQTQAE